MRKEFNIISLRDRLDLKERAAKWFYEKWKIPEEAYLESIQECQNHKEKIPQWYLVMEGSQIVGGLGVIENDFHKRKDLTPNICAVYVEENYRKLGLAKEMLEYVCKDMMLMGYTDAYLLTDHTEFYEKCGWEFFCMVEEDSGSMARLYHIALK